MVLRSPPAQTDVLPVNAVDSYVTWLRAAGVSPDTIRLRQHYLKRLA